MAMMSRDFWTKPLTANLRRVIMLSLATVGIVSSILGIGVWTYVILQEGYRVEIAIVLGLTIAALLASVGFAAYAKRLRN
jgi:NhaP-type Na+/H+ or K+/H+ antiporter